MYNKHDTQMQHRAMNTTDCNSEPCFSIPVLVFLSLTHSGKQHMQCDGTPEPRWRNTVPEYVPKYKTANEHIHPIKQGIMGLSCGVSNSEGSGSSFTCLAVAQNLLSSRSIDIWTPIAKYRKIN